MIGDEFFSKILDSIAFTSFVAQRGPPYRPCDLFDEVSTQICNNLIYNLLFLLSYFV